MADISVTAASVKVASATTRVQQVTYGGTVTHCQPLYSDSTDSNEYKPADADAAASSVAVGVSYTPGGDGDIGHIVTSGRINVGGAHLTQGVPYFVSTNAGGICPYGDLASGDYVTYIGTAISTSVLEVDIHATGIAKP